MCECICIYLYVLYTHTSIYKYIYRCESGFTICQTSLWASVLLLLPQSGTQPSSAGVCCSSVLLRYVHPSLRLYTRCPCAPGSVLVDPESKRVLDTV